MYPPTENADPVKPQLVFTRVISNPIDRVWLGYAIVTYTLRTTQSLLCSHVTK